MSDFPEKNEFLAKTAEQAERYEEMVDYMKKVCEGLASDQGLTIEQRNLLSVAYKNVVGSRRAAWRIISSIESRTAQSSDDDKAALCGQYREDVEKELEDVCRDVLNILEKAEGGLISNTKNSGDDKDKTEALVFYYKMAGDYYRYIAEFAGEGTEKNENARNQASKNYQSAMDASKEGPNALPSTHPIRLGLALNYSVFFFEVMREEAEACKLAKAAFDDAIAELDSLSEESYKDATLIMQLLRDNLTLWTSDQGEPQN